MRERDSVSRALNDKPLAKIIRMIFLQKQCNICGGGLIAYRLCSDQLSLVLMCDECEAVWVDKSDIGVVQPIFPAAPDFCSRQSMLRCGTQIYVGYSRAD